MHFLTAKFLTSLRAGAAVLAMREPKNRRPRVLPARSLFPFLILTAILFPGFAAGAPCSPGELDCSDPSPELVVPDCYAPPGLTTPPSALVPLVALPDSIVPANAGQLLPGAGSVSATGEYEYRIPIDVPAGRAGVQPSLTLAYGSRGRNGHLGVGWRLEGLSEINRCAKTFATEGYADGVQLDEADSFCLDGHKLIAINGAYGEEGTEYRTEDDVFARIKSHVTSNIGVTSFSVEMRDGRLRTYAPPPAAPGMPTYAAAAWPIQEEHDRSGNSVLYSYSGTARIEDAATDIEYYPSRIDYNTITVNGVAQRGPRNVQFEYEGRADPMSHYVADKRVKIAQRLKSILLSAPNPDTTELVWRYDLTYETGPGSGASRLKKVQRCGVKHDGGVGGCLDAKQFTWNADTRGPKYTKETLEDYNSPSAFFLVGDFGGQGRSSILRADGLGLRETVDPAHPLSRDMPCQGLASGTDLANARLVDVYGDGRTRILAPLSIGLVDAYFIIDVDSVQSTNPNDPVTCELHYSSYIPNETAGLGTACVHVTDLDGDGLPDLIKGEQGNSPTFWNWYYRLNVPQPNPQIAWLFGAKHGAPGHSPPARIEGSTECKSFSRDDGNHRGKIFPAADAHFANLTGFGLSASGAAHVASTSDGVHIGYKAWNGILDGDKATYADTDGDGIRNVVYFSDTTIYSETGMLPIDWQGLYHSNLSEWRLESADLDSDGRDDLMLVHQPDRKVLLFQEDAQGIIHESLAPFLAPSAIGDFDGDGLLDILVKSDAGQPADSVTVYHQSGPGTTDRIVGVNNAIDPGDDDPKAREAIVYSNDQFAAGSAACAYPQRCMRQGFAVVREHDVYQGADVATSGPSSRRHLYSYEDPRFDLRGRGFLGFGAVRKWDADRSAETTTTYDNATADDNGIHLVYPGALRPKSIFRVVPMDVSGYAPHGDARLSQTNYTYQLVRLNEDRTYFVHPLTWDAVEWEEDVTIDHGEAARLHITGIDGVTPESALRARSGSYEYDNFGNETDAKAATLYGVSSETVTTYNNDTVNWLIGQLRTTDVTTSNYGEPAPAPQHKDYEYDTRGLLCHVYTEKAHSDPEIPQLVTFTHDAEGLVSAITTSAKGKPLRTLHMAYEPTERVYPSETWNDLGQASWTLVDPARGLSLVSEDAAGLQAHYRYDDLGRVIQAVPEGQSPVELLYARRTTATGAVIGTNVYSIMGTGSASRSDYDVLGRAVGRAHFGFNADWIEEATTYDLLGRAVTVTRPGVDKPSNQVTQYTYDNLDRPLVKLLPGGGSVEYSHSFSSSTRSDTFTDRQTIRDVDGRVIYSIEDAHTTRIPTSYIYGPFNRLEHIVDPRGNQISVAYDQRGRRTSVSDPDAGTTIFHYNGFGDVVSKTASGDLTTYLYDVLGRPRQTSHGSEVTFTTWDTHGAGRLAHTVSPDGVEQDFKYNALGQLGKLTYTVDGEVFELDMTYDAVGRVVNLAYPTVPGQAQRFSVSQAYNVRGYLEAVYDPSLVPYHPYLHVESRNEDDRLTNIALGDNTTGTRGYDPFTGLVTDISEGSSVSLSYAYYPDGSLQNRHDFLVDREETFEYDALHRLATWGHDNKPNVGYRYDSLGNLTEVRSGATAWNPGTLLEENAYGANGKPHALTLGPQGAYTYDARGRQDTAPGRALVTYNEHDLPKKITSAPGVDTLFEYDAGGARVKKQGPSGTVLTLSGLYERRTIDGHTEHVFYVPGGDEGPIARVVSKQGDPLTSATTSYLHHDPRLGSVSAVSSASGALTESLYYEPFGRRTDALGSPLSNGIVGVPTGFTGHEHDDELGLVNMRGRMFDPTIRRFLSADPHVTDLLSGQGYNRYSYVVNDPLNLTDPTGLDWWDFGGGSWSSDGYLGQECGGSGVSTSSGVDYGYGGYSGSPSLWAPSGGNSGSVVHGGGYGGPVAASEEHRQVSVPTGPAAPGGTISGPIVKPETGGGDGAGGAPPEEPWWHGEVATLRILEKNCTTCVKALEVAYVAGGVFMVSQDLQHMTKAVEDVAAFSQRLALEGTLFRGPLAAPRVISSPGTGQVLLGGTDNPMRSMVFEGHGTTAAGSFTVPQGTWLQVPKVARLSQAAGELAAIRGTLGSGADLFPPGAVAPNLVLLPPTPDMFVRPSSTIVTRPTLLQDMLAPNMGFCVWGACQ